MKMTLHIDEALLTRVIEAYGFSTKTEAIDSALHEMDRRARFKAFVATPSLFSPEELKAGVEPGYDVHRMRVAESSGKYGKTK